jgi:hypothetical protein
MKVAQKTRGTASFRRYEVAGSRELDAARTAFQHFDPDLHLKIADLPAQ